MAKEPHPDDYGDIMVEALRMVVTGPDEVIIGFQIWDMDDFSNELSILFRAKGFEKVERLAGMKALVRDLWFGDGELFVLTNNEVQRFSKGNFKKPITMKLPIKAARAIGGSSVKDLVIVGEGVARFDGAAWTSLAMKTKVELTCLSVHGDVAYAGGKDGALVQISGNDAKLLTTPSSDKADINEIHIDDKGVLSVAGKVSFQGPPDKLAVFEMPEDVDNAVGVGSFKGKTYWGCVGDDDGLGLFVQNGKKLEPVNGEMAVAMTATDRFLYTAGEGGVVRYDGESFAALGLDYDEDKKQWKLEVAEAEDGEGDDDDE